MFKCGLSVFFTGGSAVSLCEELDDDDDVSGDGALRVPEDSSEPVAELLELDVDLELELELDDDEDDDDDDEDDDDDKDEEEDDEEDEDEDGDCGLGVG